MYTAYFASCGNSVSGLILGTGDTLNVYSGGTALNTIVNESAFMSAFENAVANSTTINAGGILRIFTSAKAANTAIHAAGEVDVSAGGVMSKTTILGGRMIVTQGGYAHQTTISSGWTGVDSNGEVKSITVGPGGNLFVSMYGSATEVMENGGYVGTANYSVVTFASNSFSGVVLSGTHSASVHSGTTANSTTINADGFLAVFSGGTANVTTVNDNGFFTVSSGGTANSTTINKGGTLTLFESGVATSTTINKSAVMRVNGTANSTTVNSGGSFNVYTNGTVTRTTIGSGGSAFIQGSAVTISINSCAVLDLNGGGTAIQATVNSGGKVNVAFDGTLDGATIGNGGLVQVSSGGTASNTKIEFNANMNVWSDGRAIRTTVSSGGSIIVNLGATAEGIKLSNGSAIVDVSAVLISADVSSGGYVELAGTASSATVSDGGHMKVLDGGTANDLRVNDGGMLNIVNKGTLNNATVNSGGTAIVSGLASGSSILVTGGELQVLSNAAMRHAESSNLTVTNNGHLLVCGTVDGAVVSSKGKVTVETTGTFANATVTAANVTAKNNALISGLTLSSGGILNLSSGATLRNTTVSAGGIVTGVLRNTTDLAFSGGTLDLNIAKSSENDGFLVEAGAYTQIKSDAFACTITVASKQLNGTYKLIEGAAGFNKTITVKNSVGYQFGTLTVGSGPTELLDGVTYDLKLTNGDLVVTVDGGAIPDPIYSGGTLIDERKDITSGMSAIDVNVSSGGILNVFSSGEASNTTVYNGGIFNVHSDGDLKGATIYSGGTATLFEDAAARDVIVNGGTLEVESGAYIFQTSKGKVVTSNIIVTNGGKVNVNGGWVEGALVSSGQVVIESDGSMFNASVASGTVQVKDGAYAGMTILYGGGVNVESGGTAACTVSSGGMIRLEDGCDLNNGLKVYEGGVLTGVMHGITQVVKMYGGTLNLDISEAAPSGEYLFDMDANIDFDQGMSCTITVNANQAYGTYNLMEYAYGFDTLITPETPLTVKNTNGLTLATIFSVGSTTETFDMCFTLNLSDDNHLTVTVEEGIPLPPEPPEPEPPEPTPADDMPFFTGDFDGSGKAMLAAEKDSTVRIYSNGAEWGNGLALETGWTVVGTGDFNADKKDDFLRVNTEGYVVGEMSQGDGTFAAQVLNLKSAGWSTLGTGDFNGNGSDDVLIANPTAASETVGLLGYWESGVTWTLINGYSAEWEMVSTGDFNGDGKCDMLWKNEFIGAGDLTYNAYCTWIVEDPVDWRMVSVANPAEWNFLCSGDFDGNGSHDIAMINDVGVVGIWGVNDGYLSSWSILSAVTSEWTLAGVADFNGDGTDDIAWSNTDTGLTGYWQINDKTLTTWANIATLQAV